MGYISSLFKFLDLFLVQNSITEFKANILGLFEYETLA
jgi:hypothetical protein